MVESVEELFNGFRECDFSLPTAAKVHAQSIAGDDIQVPGISYLGFDKADDGIQKPDRVADASSSRNLKSRRYFVRTVS